MASGRAADRDKTENRPPTRTSISFIYLSICGLFKDAICNSD